MKINWLAVILVFALVVRIVGLDRFNSSMNVDEVAIGYDAYSILKTGRDHLGNLLPVVFPSLGDYKPGLYIYVVAIFEALFGLNEYAVRLPSALAGTFSVYLIYRLVSNIYKEKKTAIAASLIYATMPLTIVLSRGGYESNFALALLLAGLVWLQDQIDKEGHYWALLLFPLSMYTYHNEKLLAMIMLVGIIWWNRFEIKKRIKVFSVWMLLMLVFCLPLLQTINPTSQTRARDKFILNDPLISSIEGNAKIGATISIGMSRYLQAFDPTAYFAKGMNMTFTNNMDMGWMGIWLFPIFGIGLWAFFSLSRKKLKIVSWKTLVLLTLITPIPSAITMDDYHNFRLLPISVILSVIAGLGLTKLMQIKMGKILGVSLVMMNVVMFVLMYTVVYQSEKSHWQFDPMKEVALYAHSISGDTKVLIDPRFGKEGPYIFGVPEFYLLFYGKVDPNEYRQTKRDGGFGKFDFRNVDWQVERKLANTVIIASEWSITEGTYDKNKLLKKFSFVDGQTAYLAVSSDK